MIVIQAYTTEGNMLKKSQRMRKGLAEVQVWDNAGGENQLRHRGGGQ